MATNQGPASGNGVLFLGNPPTASVEVQVPSGAPSLEPSRAPFVDPGQVGFSAGSLVVPINKTITFGSSGATVVIANPA